MTGKRNLLTTITVPIAEIKPYTHNPRKNQGAVAVVAQSLEEYGWQQPIVVDENMVIIAGHTRLMAAERLGMAFVPIHVAKGLSAAQVKAYRIMDNRSRDNSDWEKELLRDELLDLQTADVDLSLTGFTDKELEYILRDDFEASPDDEAPEPPARPTSQEGDLWALGPHRLLCGDAGSGEAVARLMDGQKADMVFTDPPYNVNYGLDHVEGTSWRRRSIKNDDMTTDEFRNFCQEWAALIKGCCTGCVYVCGSSGRNGRIIFTVLDSLFHPSTIIVWNKDRFVFGRGKYHSKHELIWFGWNETGSGFVKDRTLHDVWDIDRPTLNELHPTMKPIQLMETAMHHASKQGDLILDVFGGSGSTLIACEKIGRVARMMEMEPAYVDVIIRRWQEYAEQAATLAGDNRTFAEIVNERL